MEKKIELCRTGERDYHYKKFEELCDIWMEQHKNQWKSATVAKYSVILANHLKPCFGMYTIQEIDSEKIATFSNELLYVRQLAVKTVRDILSLLCNIITDIHTHFSLNCTPVQIVYPRVAPTELRVLTEEEQTRLMLYLNQDMDVHKYAVLLALTTGLRVGEICGLRWKDISLESGLLTVTQTVQRIKNMDSSSTRKTILQIGTPKTACSCRTIPFTDGMLERIRQFYASDPESFLLTGTKNFEEPRVLQRRLKQYTTETCIEKVHFHTLRHTFATRCVEVGCDIKTLSEILGHSTIAMTMNRYVHPSIACKKKNMEKLNQAGFGC